MTIIMNATGSVAPRRPLTIGTLPAAAPLGAGGRPKIARGLALLALALALVAGVYSGGAYADLQGTEGLVRISSPATLSAGGWSAGLFGHYYYREAPYAVSVKEQYALGNLSGRYGFNDKLELVAVLPGKGSLWKFDELPDREEKSEDHGGPADAQLGLKLRIPLEGRAYSFALIAQASVPTGKTTEYFLPGEETPQRLFSSGTTSFFGRACGAFDLSRVRALSPLRILVNFGYWLNREKEVLRFPSYMPAIPGRLENKDVFLTGLAFEFPSPQVTLFTELYTEQFVNGSGVAKFRECPILLTPGVRAKLPYGLIATAAIDIRLSVDDADTEFNPEDILPEWAFTLGFDFVPAIFRHDADEDGVIDSKDLCPTEKEDIDGFQDADGCPDLDNDKDGIIDTLDRCPNQAENINGYMDADGCPEPDGDRDGVPDALDKCLTEAEDVDGFEDADGCPDLDNDEDGIPDTLDKCSNEPETLNGYEDEDGCPDSPTDAPKAEIDTDQDGIPDSKDKCPSLAEDVDGFQDADGCPDVDNDLDGVMDAEDACPNEPEDLDGVNDTDGCPDR